MCRDVCRYPMGGCGDHRDGCEYGWRGMLRSVLRDGNWEWMGWAGDYVIGVRKSEERVVARNTSGQK